MGSEQDSQGGGGAPVRDKSAAEIAALVGFEKRQLQNWAKKGVRGEKCPAEFRPKPGCKQNEWWFNLDEVQAWRKKVGMAEARPDAPAAAPPPLLAHAEAERKAKEDNSIRVAMLKAELVERIMKGDPIASAKMTLLRVLELVEKAKLDAEIGGAALKQLTDASSTIASELRMIAKIEREQDDRAAGRMLRSVGNKILVGVADMIRQQLSSMGGEMAAAVRMAALDRGVTLEQAEAFDRVAATTIQERIDAKLDLIAETVRAAMLELERASEGNAAAPVSGGAGGLFTGAAA